MQFSVAVQERIRRGLRDDAGMTTVEYAVGTVVAAALAAVLYKIVTGDSIVTGLTNLVTRALGSV
ncbi:DUF4244 domain-containing protein [Nakamurella sp. A5-74]|uniref:DUF4244 domain-containing protein n=1 Tax=Nakamurella sp. A5-74 TaxID=3158264 RepID=A0AAU8DX21_9ACTN